jgi:hypothetical protein
MLTIREEQLRVFRDDARERFVCRLTDHFVALYPRECRQAGGPAGIRKVVERALKGAVSHIYETEEQASLYIALAFMLGCDFDRDPQLPWVRDWIDDRDAFPDTSSRIRQLYDYATDYLGDTAGENCSHLVRALIRIQQWSPADAPPGEGPEWRTGMCSLLGMLYPQKLQYQGEQATSEMLEWASVRCGMHGIRGSSGRAIYGILAFMLGCGFDHDPGHPWAEQALAMSGASEQDRVRCLYDAAMQHVSTSLEAD